MHNIHTYMIKHTTQIAANSLVHVLSEHDSTQDLSMREFFLNLPVLYQARPYIATKPGFRFL